jgi:hypothetical protein
MSMLSALLAVLTVCGLDPGPAPAHWLLADDHGQLAVAPGLHQSVQQSLQDGPAVKSAPNRPALLYVDLPVGSLGELALELRPMPTIAYDALVGVGSAARQQDAALTSALRDTARHRRPERVGARPIVASQPTRALGTSLREPAPRHRRRS